MTREVEWEHRSGRTPPHQAEGVGVGKISEVQSIIDTSEVQRSEAGRGEV